jgi:hypothetical protein
LSVCISSDRGIFTVVDGITCGCKHCKPWGKIYGLIERRLVFSCSYEYGDGRQPERWVPFFYPPAWWSRSSLVSLCFLYGTAMQNWVLWQEMECECTQWILSCCAIYWWWPMYVCPPLPLHHHSAHELNILSCELAACLNWRLAYFHYLFLFLVVLLTGSPDCSIVATDVETGQAVARLTGAHGYVT